ncbi:MAG TPA: helix-turn-helix transcriptional regulator [Chitinophagaceae bacterium]|jgi:transcriptional regulator with XRE-family HTH domain
MAYLQFYPTISRAVKSKIDQYVVSQVKERRLALKLSQADLAYELDISVGFIGKVESSNYSSHYNIRHLNDLAKILKCSPQDFLPKKPL